jgi:hypothetical protein
MAEGNRQCYLKRGPDASSNGGIRYPERHLRQYDNEDNAKLTSQFSQIILYFRQAAHFVVQEITQDKHARDVKRYEGPCLITHSQFVKIWSRVKDHAQLQ